MKSKKRKLEIITVEEAYRIHDMLKPVVYGDISISMARESENIIHAWLDMLCFVLRHPNGKHVEEQLKAIEERIKELGYEPAIKRESKL